MATIMPPFQVDAPAPQQALCQHCYFNNASHLPRMQSYPRGHIHPPMVMSILTLLYAVSSSVTFSMKKI